MALSLRPQLHYCVANGRVVLLDLAKDRYFALPDPLDEAFQTLTARGGSFGDHTTGIRNLVEQGILTQKSDVTGPPHAPSLPRPAHSFVDSPPAGWVNPITFLQALLAQRRANADHSGLTLPHYVRRVSDMLAKSDDARIEAPSAQTLGALRAYLATRWLITTRDQCLLQSATLFQFLARRGWHPRFVVAVRMAPFAAHAWVQSGETVLNDRLDHVLPYTPILVL
ncbi:lasso peptide biosynthesis B2 protein [Asticcacaulis taihuensis]|uniref:Transglutaminase-like superfamily protein n=1 Tax=Asticcacaulis taihuensis TaxID=260084 RepID=A0A1G4PUV7_9CAUL|nr:lasso peptide biosynthesis B2 protein [Asticcacaulis taihuensis]SCW36080.1 Transglutaminase-like superfamily protein [Asticcacaulis taihuensis]